MSISQYVYNKYCYRKITNERVLMFFFSALKQIRTNLNHSHHKRALAVLKAAMITWPDCDIFATTELSAEQVDEQRYFDRLCQVLTF